MAEPNKLCSESDWSRPTTFPLLSQTTRRRMEVGQRKGACGSNHFLADPPRNRSYVPRLSHQEAILRVIPDNVRQLKESFLNGEEKVDVFPEGLLCGLRAMRTSILAQFGKPAPTVKEPHTIAQSDDMLAEEFNLLQDALRLQSLRLQSLQLQSR